MAEEITYEFANEAKDIVDDLIPQYHERLAECHISPICIFRSKHTKSKGRAVYAKAKIITGLPAFIAHNLGDPDAEELSGRRIWVIEIAKDLWFDELSLEQRVALIDHELSHFDPIDGIRGHDLEEFRGVVERHGIWRPDLMHFAGSLQKALELGPSHYEGGSYRPGSGLADVIRGLAPKKGSSVESVTISAGGKSVTLTQEDSDTLDSLLPH